MKKLLRALLPVMVVGSTVAAVAVAPALAEIASAANTCDTTANWAAGNGGYGHCVGTFPTNQRFRVRIHCNGNPIRPSYDRWGPWVAQFSSRGGYLTSWAYCDTSAGEWLYSVAGETTFV